MADIFLMDAVSANEYSFVHGSAELDSVMTNDDMVNLGQSALENFEQFIERGSLSYLYLSFDTIDPAEETSTAICLNYGVDSAGAGEWFNVGVLSTSANMSLFNAFNDLSDFSDLQNESTVNEMIGAMGIDTGAKENLHINIASTIEDDRYPGVAVSCVDMHIGEDVLQAIASGEDFTTGDFYSRFCPESVYISSGFLIPTLGDSGSVTLLNNVNFGFGWTAL